MSKRRKNKHLSTKAIKSQVLAKVARAKTLPPAAETIGFSELEESFFEAGAALERDAAGSVDEAQPPRPSFWRRLLSRTQTA
jgi:hypothetical protein